MQCNNENVILFPKWRKSLEEESLKALKEKRYPEALEKLNELLSYQVNSHEISIGKLICLMELGEYEDAQTECERLLKNKDEYYYEYVHLYLTILFQTNQYLLLMEQVEYELKYEEIPNVIKEQFQQLHTMSEVMENDKTEKIGTEYIEELVVVVHKEDHFRQWQLIENLSKMNIKPTKLIISYLVNKRIHPVIKTSLFMWLRDQKVAQSIDVHKLNLQIKIKPIDVPKIRDHTIYKQILLLINDLEQQNPTLFILLEQRLFRYLYVRYPIMPKLEDIKHIADTLKDIGQQEGKELSEDIVLYKNEIEMCETLYLSIIEE